MNGSVHNELAGSENGYCFAFLKKKKIKNPSVECTDAEDSIQSYHFMWFIELKEDHGALHTDRHVS